MKSPYDDEKRPRMLSRLWKTLKSCFGHGFEVDTVSADMYRRVMNGLTLSISPRGMDTRELEILQQASRERRCTGLVMELALPEFYLLISFTLRSKLSVWMMMTWRGENRKKSRRHAQRQRMHDTIDVDETGRIFLRTLHGLSKLYTLAYVRTYLNISKVVSTTPTMRRWVGLSDLESSHWIDKHSLSSAITLFN